MFGASASILALASCAPPALQSSAYPGLAEALSAEGVSGPYRQATVDLNSDGRDEVVVRLEGRDWCGSGGCTALVLTPDAAGWLTVMRATVTRLPFRKLETESQGWADVSVSIGGGGLAGGEALMAFDGEAYPSNPTTAPARLVTGAVGTIILDETAPLTQGN